MIFTIFKSMAQSSSFFLDIQFHYYFIYYNFLFINLIIKLINTDSFMNLLIKPTNNLWYL
jgi:hypothetical protein